ncbi:hypothetical protein ABH935_005441 [Catenulispora sp. GAS73]
MIIPAVTMTRPEEVDGLYHGARRIFPEDWEQFRDHAQEAERDGRVPADRGCHAHPSHRLRPGRTAT